MSLTINTVVDGKPMVLHVHEMHITSNNNQPIASYSGNQNQEYTDEYLKNHNDYNGALQNIHEQMNTQYSANPNNTQAIAQQHQGLLNQAANVANSNLSNLVAANKVFKLPAVPTAAAPLFSQETAPVYDPQQYSAPPQNVGEQSYDKFAPHNAPPLVFDNAPKVPQNFAPVYGGGSKKRRNKQKKRTRKRMRSRKRSTKR